MGVHHPCIMTSAIEPSSDPGKTLSSRGKCLVERNLVASIAVFVSSERRLLSGKRGMEKREAFSRRTLTHDAVPLVSEITHA